MPFLLIALVVLALNAACSKPAPEPMARAIPAIVKAGTTLTASPNPIILSEGSALGETTIQWTTTAKHVELRLGGPDGKQFSGGGSRGAAKTGTWVTNGMTFYLQDMDAPNPTSAAATLGRLAVSVSEVQIL